MIRFQLNVLIVFFVFTSSAIAQKVSNFMNSKDTSNLPIVAKMLTGDSLSNSFYLSIKDEVKLHKHTLHSEHIYVLQGKARMVLGSDTFEINKGDFIFIPRNTAHKVNVLSKQKLEVISIQSPFFDGKDRVLLE